MTSYKKLEEEEDIKLEIGIPLDPFAPRLGALSKRTVILLGLLLGTCFVMIAFFGGVFLFKQEEKQEQDTSMSTSPTTWPSIILPTSTLSTTMSSTTTSPTTTKLKTTLKLVSTRRSSTTTIPILTPNKKLEQIRHLSKTLNFTSNFTGETCLAEGCLDASLTLLSSINSSANPCKNFFQYSCGNWVKANRAPSRGDDWNQFAKLQHFTDELLIKILMSKETEENNHFLKLAQKKFQKCLNYYGYSKDVCLAEAKSYYGGVIAKEFVRKIGFDAKSKKKVTTLTESIVDALTDLINDSNWLTSKTIGEILKHLSNIKRHIAFPVHWNISEAMPKGWSMAVTEANAVYYSVDHSITIPAAILQPLFYSEEYPQHQIYARMGWLIGHEFGHALDPTGITGIGSSFERMLRLSGYDKKTECFQKEYSEFYSKVANMYLNGKLTLDENIADNIGVRSSYKAYMKHVEENGEDKRLPGLEGFTPQQLFFLGFANIHCDSVGRSALELELEFEPHSPSKYRVIGTLRNIDEFAKTFNCPINEIGMNPPQDRKCKLW